MASHSNILAGIVPCIEEPGELDTTERLRMHTLGSMGESK